MYVLDRKLEMWKREWVIGWLLQWALVDPLVRRLADNLNIMGMNPGIGGTVVHHRCLLSTVDR